MVCWALGVGPGDEVITVSSSFIATANAVRYVGAAPVFVDVEAETGNINPALIEEAMSNYHRYFFIMPTLARFELELHTRAEKGQPINADILIGLTADLFKEGYGDEVAFDRDRIGVIYGSGIGGMLTYDAQFRNFMGGGSGR